MFRAVGIGGSVFLPLEGPERIENLLRDCLKKAEDIEDPYKQSFFAMVLLPYLQPFEDENNQASRLAANIPMVRKNLCPLSFVDVDQRDYVNGLLGIYELNRVELLRDVFVRAYRRSWERYAAVRHSLGDPDPFRLRHRERIGECIRIVMSELCPRRETPERLRVWAASQLPETDRVRFVDVVTNELASLHVGNIARFRLRPDEFATRNHNQSNQPTADP